MPKRRPEGFKSSPILPKPSGVSWMSEILEASAVISGIIRIMHPDQYQMARDMLWIAQADTTFQPVLTKWPSMFSAISIIANCISLFYHKQHGDYCFFDILLSCGQYTVASIKLQPLGFHIPNRLGTVIGCSGKATCHGTAELDRSCICLAFYMRTSVQFFLCIRPCQWMVQEVYRPWIGAVKNAVYKLLSGDPFV